MCVLQVQNFGGAAGLKGEKGDRVSMEKSVFIVVMSVEFVM